MKQCPNCQFETTDEAKFCPNCGHPLEQRWFYVLGTQNYGPHTKEEMLDLYDQGRLNRQSLVRQGEQGEWVLYEASSLYVPEQPKRIWYYMKDGQQLGPYSEAEINDFVKQQVIVATTLMFCEGDDKWVYFTKTPFFVESKPEPEPEIETEPKIEPEPVYQEQPHSQERPRFFFEKRSVGLCILLSIITCGLYYFVWLYNITKDTNKVLAENAQPLAAEPALAVIFSILTCGLYTIYWNWRIPSSLEEIKKPNGRLVDISSTLCVILSFFMLSVVSLAVIQSELNEFA